MIDFRVLQSNFELEQNSKLVLMDQIEYYEKERLKEEVTTKANEAVDGLDSSREVHIDTYHTLNALQDQTDSSEDGFDTSDIGFVNGHSRMLSSLADEITSSSSPIKNRVPSLQTTSNFKFPPSPNPDSITNKAASTSISGGIEEGLHKRQSLPSKLKTSPHLEQEEFVLSPLKLTANHDYITSTSSYFDVSASTERRYSNSKPHHSRYNSHDILPIKVEFEQKDNNILRSTSVPERVHHERDAIHRNSIRNSAFMALHGAEKTTEKESSGASNRNSLLTESSSKRSSIIMDQSILTSDMTKQEIMKLKFELQSLKLHNEKLLSYIGFELQKQKKNIKKLSHKQSLSELNNNNNNNNNKKKMEYSDAKLIEKSKEMLIHKKRVLRSVSINPIISKGGNRNSQIIGKGLINQPEDSYQLFDGEDKYGFLSKEDSEKFNSRFFDNDMRHYYEIDEEDEEMEGGSIKLPKKFKSQVFRHTEYDSSEEYEDGDEEVESWQEESEQDTMTIYESVEQEPKEEQPEPSSVFSSIKYLFVGNTTTKKEKVNDSVDETLKYKFFLVAAGIMIIGIRFSHQQH